MLVLKTLSTLITLALLTGSSVNGQYSTTFTTTQTETVTSASPTVTETSTTTLADALATVTTTLQTTLDAATTTTVSALDAQTVTVTLPASTTTVTNANCVEYALKFGKGCCPQRYMRKLSTHPHPHPHPSVGLKPRFWPVYGENRGQEKRAISGPIPTTASCSVSSFLTFTTTKGTLKTIVTAYDFGTAGGRVRIQDLYNVNVCGDVYIDGVKAGSTTCPGLTGGNTNDYQSDPDAAIASGNFGYAYVDVPAGTHTITFMETYSGGQGYYQISSNMQCPALAYIDQQTATVFATLTESTTMTVGPTSTQTSVITEIETSIPDDIINVITTTPPAVTTTIVPAPIQTTVNSCRIVTLNMACPKYKKQTMLDKWALGKLQSTKQKNLDDDEALSVSCIGSKSSYEYD